MSVAGTDGGNDESVGHNDSCRVAREQSWPLCFAGLQANYLQNIRRALARPELRS
jgi:hypothetical protein